MTGESLFSDTSPSYKLTLYPSDEFNETYGTHNPMISAIGAVLAIVLTSFCFWAYDHSVNRDLVLKKQMFLAGWNHRKRYEEEGRDAGDDGPDEEEQRVGITESAIEPVVSRESSEPSSHASTSFSVPIESTVDVEGSV